jgi:hypothetical protein
MEMPEEMPEEMDARLCDGVVGETISLSMQERT